MIDKNIKGIVEKEKTLPKESQWKAFPPPLKFLFVLLVFNVLFSLSSLLSSGKTGYFFLGTNIYDFAAIAAVLLLNVAGSLVLLLALWKNFDWTWKYGTGYFGFFILNGLIAFGSILPNLFGPVIQNVVMIKLAFIILLSLILNILFLVILIKNRKYSGGSATK